MLLGFHSYFNANNSLPDFSYNTPAFVPKGGSANCVVYNINPFVAVLPYVDNGALYDVGTSGIDVNGNPSTGISVWDCWTGKTGSTAYFRLARMKLYECPSDPGLDANGFCRWQVNSWTATSYAVNFQIFGSPTGNGNSASCTITNIKDGASNTVLLTEKMATCQRTPGQSGNTGNLWTHLDSADWSPAIANSRAGWAPYNGAWNQTPQYQPSYSAGGNNVCDASRASTGHSECVTGMGDGSVRLVGRKVSQTTWVSALLPSDGVPLGSDW
jgi:hypothetical protein